MPGSGRERSRPAPRPPRRRRRRRRLAARIPRSRRRMGRCRTRPGARGRDRSVSGRSPRADLRHGGLPPRRSRDRAAGIARAGDRGRDRQPDPTVDPGADTLGALDAIGGSVLGIVGVAVLAWLVLPVMSSTAGLGCRRGAQLRHRPLHHRSLPGTARTDHGPRTSARRRRVPPHLRGYPSSARGTPAAGRLADRGRRPRAARPEHGPRRGRGMWSAPDGKRMGRRARPRRHQRPCRRGLPGRAHGHRRRATASTPRSSGSTHRPTWPSSATDRCPTPAHRRARGG